MSPWSHTARELRCGNHRSKSPALICPVNDMRPPVVELGDVLHHGEHELGDVTLPQRSGQHHVHVLGRSRRPPPGLGADA